jgi:hypothetical protein
MRILLLISTLFFSLSIIAQEQKDSATITPQIIIKRPLFVINDAGVKWTILPKFAPLIPINQILENATKQGISSEIVPENNFVAGLRFDRYSPLTPFSFGVEANYLHQTLSLRKNNVHTLFTGSVECTPFVSFSPSKILQVGRKNNLDLFHFTIEGGISYSNAITRTLTVFDENKYKVYNQIGLIDNDAWRIYGGIGYVYDALSSNHRHLEQFKFLLQYYRPLDANYFKESDAFDSPTKKVANHKFFQEYATLSVGYLFSLDKPKIEGKQSNYEIFFPKRYRYFRMPWYYEEPEKKSFGGFYWSLINNPKTNDVTFRLSDSLQGNGYFRVRYNMSVGYHFHFLSNFNDENEQKLRYGLFTGVSYNRRNILQDEITYTRYQQLNTIAAEFGGRIGIKPGIYFLAGGAYHFAIKGLTVSDKPNTLAYLDKRFFTYYVGLGLRNLASIQIQNNPLIPFDINAYQFIKKMEYKITIGF